MRDAAREFYDRVMVTVSRRDDLMHILENKGGFSTFKTRDTGRADMVVPGLIKQEGAWAALSTAKWLPLIKRILGPDACLRHAGVIMAMPNAVAQKCTRTGIISTTTSYCRRRALMFRAVGPLRRFKWGQEFVPGTHADWTASSHRMCWMRRRAAAWRTGDSSTGVLEQTERRPALLYLTYARPGSSTSRTRRAIRAAASLASLDATRSERADIRDMA